MIDTTGTKVPAYTENDTTYTLAANGVKALFSRKSGLLLHVENANGVFPFTNGPVLSAGSITPATYSNAYFAPKATTWCWKLLIPNKAFAGIEMDDGSLRLAEDGSALFPPNMNIPYWVSTSLIRRKNR